MDVDRILNALGVTLLLGIMIAWAIWPDQLDTLLVLGVLVVGVPWAVIKVWRERTQR